MKTRTHSIVATWAACALALSLVLVPTAAGATEPTRDPMQPPITSNTRSSTLPVGARHAPRADAPSMPRHLMVIDGQRYVIERGQRLGVGDRLGGARIERIGDGVVWLRDASGLREVTFYDGVVKRAHVAHDDAAAPSPRTAAPAAARPAARALPAPRPRIAAAHPHPPEPRAP